MSSNTHDLLMHVTTELHSMFIQATQHVLSNPSYWHHFEFPEAYWPLAQKSFSRGDKTLTGRLDFSVTKEQGIKCYEYNADSASCLMECGYIQGAWSKAANLTNIGEDAGSLTSIMVTAAWKKLVAPGTLVHFLHDDDDEERYHTLYMMQLASDAGMVCKAVDNSLINSFRFNTNSQIIDDEGRLVTTVWKTWSYVTLLAKLHEEQFILHHSSEQSVRLIDVCFNDDVTVFEPVWTAITSNKAILPVLSELFPSSPYLLASSFSVTQAMHLAGYASKPISGRCGENVSLHFASDVVDVADASSAAVSDASGASSSTVQTRGRFEQDAFVYQELCPLPKVDGQYVQVNCFVANGQYAGTVTRADESPIIGWASDSFAMRVVAEVARGGSRDREEGGAVGQSQWKHRSATLSPPESPARSYSVVSDTSDDLSVDSHSVASMDGDFKL